MNIFHRILDFFRSPRVKNALDRVATLAQTALPIVETIASLTPTRVDDEIIAAYKHFGVPFVDAELSGDPKRIGTALLNLGTVVLARQAPGTSTSLLQTAVQLAVTVLKASK